MTGFGMYDTYNLQNVEKSGFGQTVSVRVCLCLCVYVCVSVLLLPFPRALTGVRVKRSS